LQWTAAEFFAGDSVTTFTQRLASVLGIDASRIKVVSVFEGSVNVEVQILDDPAMQITKEDGTLQPQTSTLAIMTTLSSTLVAAVSAGSTVLGAPVLEIKANVFSNVVTTVIDSPAIVQPGKASNFVLPVSAFAIAIAAILL
jgi:hypothetical protein